ncbi:hypothetical protein CDD81_2958 [Ophiocordyceps australis]|uniref:NADH-ubiquinone oxidoreductase 17.8 kDa subunit n=1 Tax=Ophiocordyceps australis TaxID=1399860 RepID=A0A2C5XCD6_9HYPO|nr:hypothetical protein CDD81_2958 [Ophiocordyceps australis]
MFVTSRQSGLLVRRLQQTCRQYSSEPHSSHPSEQPHESFGKGSLAFVCIILGGVFVYQVAPRKGQESAIRDFFECYRSRPGDWEDINTLHTKAMEQAGYDRNLFENSTSNNRHVNVGFPEALQSHAARNIRAGSIMNIDHVVEHYRQAHLKEEDRKARRQA